MDALASFLRSHCPLLEAHVVNFFGVPPSPPLPCREFLEATDLKGCLLKFSICWRFELRRIGCGR
uniref:Uncharacterized protein n=1 Tax=Arundo donax TaxID=35708 RepID=A0A0A9GBC7_ARUDO